MIQSIELLGIAGTPYDTVLDKTYCNIGDTTTFQSVAQPELSEEGNGLKMSYFPPLILLLNEKLNKYF